MTMTTGFLAAPSNHLPVSPSITGEIDIPWPEKSDDKAMFTLRGLNAASRNQLRRQAISLKEAGHDYASIGRRLHMTALVARDLCQQHRRSVRRQLSDAGLVPLPKAVIDLLVSGPYAVLVASTTATRIKYLVKICSLYTSAELLRERGLGRLTLIRIENWLTAQGYRLRGQDESITEAICRLERRGHWRISRKSWQSLDDMSVDQAADVTVASSMATTILTVRPVDLRLENKKHRAAT